MPIVITDDDARRLLSIPEAIEAMRGRFQRSRDGEGGQSTQASLQLGDRPIPSALFRQYPCRRITKLSDRLRARRIALHADRRHDGQRRSLDNPEPGQLVGGHSLQSRNGEPLAFMHETFLSGFRVGATTALGVAECARAGCGGARPVSEPAIRPFQLPGDMRGAADQAREGVQPECARIVTPSSRAHGQMSPWR